MATQTIERPTTRAVVKYVGRSAYKVRRVADLIRGKQAEEAQNILTMCDRGAKEELQKLLNSAIANAEHNQQIPVEELKVKTVFVDEAPTAKRFKARARGRGNRIFKRNCHITIILERMTQEEIERKSEKDSASGAAGAREQRRRRAEASKAAAKAKQAALEAKETEDSTVEESTDDAAKPKKAKAKVSPKKKADADAKPVAKKTAAKAADEESAKRTIAGSEGSETESEGDASSATADGSDSGKDDKEEGDA